MIYELDHHDFNADPDLGLDYDEQALTAEQVEERMDAILRAWGWTEDRRDDRRDDEDDEFQWDHDTNLAYTLACNAPSGTPLTVFTAILEARGWPRTDHFA